MAAAASSVSVQSATGSTVNTPPFNATVTPTPADKTSVPAPTAASEVQNSTNVKTEEVVEPAVKKTVGETRETENRTTQKLNPIHEWIDKERPLYCKVCDFQAQSTEVI